MIHFWAPAETASADDVLAWEPDRDPGRFANGFGHSVVELFRRLEGAGVDVTLGEEAPRGTELVVVFPKSVYQTRRLRAALGAGARAGGRFAVIRSDTPLQWRFPVRPVVEFMPNRTVVREPWQRWVPPLPQRGLIRRRVERRGRIRSLSFKGYAENLPPELSTSEWRAGLEKRGIEWVPDIAADSDGAGQQWHDFSVIDAVLCVRAVRTTQNTERKPATRLINAWSAGCVPIAERDLAYVELGTDGADVFFVDSPLAALQALDRLNGDPDLLARAERLVDERAAEFATGATLERWHEALLEAADSPRARSRRVQSTRVAAARARVGVGVLLGPGRRVVGRARARAACWKRRALRSGVDVGSGA